LHLIHRVSAQEDLAFLKDHIQRGTRVLIFCPTRNDTALVYDFFMLAYPELCLAKQVEVLHSEISLLKRRSVFAGWREAKIQVLINTSLLSNVSVYRKIGVLNAPIDVQGVNVDDVQLIVHYGSPRSFLQYIQEVCHVRC
jgi:superfamily II DNA/RNA helicase